MLPGAAMARAQRSQSPPVAVAPESRRSVSAESSATEVMDSPGRASGGLVAGKVRASTSIGARNDPSGRPRTRS
jgi:hypothetical protein